MKCLTENVLMLLSDLKVLIVNSGNFCSGCHIIPEGCYNDTNPLMRNIFIENGR